MLTLFLLVKPHQNNIILFPFSPGENFSNISWKLLCRESRQNKQIGVRKRGRHTEGEGEREEAKEKKA